MNLVTLITCTISKVIIPSVSTWKEGQPASANCGVTVLVAMTNCINSPPIMGGKMKYKQTCLYRCKGLT